MMTAEGANARLRPAVATSGWLAGTIEEERYESIGHLARQLADQRQGIFRYRPTVLANLIHLHLQRCVVPALPVEDHLEESTLEAHDDLVECRAQDPHACRS